MNAAPEAASPRLDLEQFLAEARDAARLTDFGDPWFLAPLQKLIDSINATRDLTTVEALGIQVMKTCLVDRLRLVDLMKRNPAIRDERIDVAGIIAGLPRGGSTFLHRLLCSSPQTTAPYYWELMSPLPLPGEHANDPSPRIRHAQGILDSMAANAPGSTAIHPMSATAYDEESFLISRSFLSVDYIFYFHLPDYIPWLRTQDQTKAYAELVLWLQALQFQDPARRGKKWILKSGHHLWCGGLKYLRATFPQAKMFMSHRRLQDVIPSLCSLQSVFLKPYSRNFEPKALGPEALQLYRNGLADFMHLRSQGPADRFVDFRYADLVADPITQYRMALNTMGLSVGDKDLAATSAWLAESRKDAGSRHSYTLQEFGLTDQDVARQFAFYTDQFLQPA